jgi:hypothetical protein
MSIAGLASLREALRETRREVHAKAAKNRQARKSVLRSWMITLTGFAQETSAVGAQCL